ncbi:MAG: FtsB family cell division protein [Candidatus Rokuibacteriota bacterium]
MTWWRPHPGWIVAGLLTMLLVVAVFGENGILHLRRLRAEIEALHRDVQALDAENERLSRAIGEVRTDPAAIERIAREELGLVRPGERVLRFPRTPRAAAPGVAGPAVPRSP